MIISSTGNSSYRLKNISGHLSMDGRFSMMRRLNDGRLPLSAKRFLVQSLPEHGKGEHLNLFA